MSIKLHGVYSIPIPLHLDIGDCLNKCRYCFVGSKDKKTSIKQIENAINKKYDGSLLSYYLENRYPICISNTSDFFNCNDKETYKSEIQMLRDAGFPIYYQTKGYHSEEDLEWFLKIVTKKDVVYITITSFDDSAKLLEKKAPSIENRLNLIKKLKKKGIMINVGFNPVISKYISNQEIIKFMSKNPEIGYIIQPLHGIKNIYANSKEINSLTRSQNIKLRPIMEFAIKNKISVRSKNIFSIKTPSYGDILKKHFGKPILIGSDLDIFSKEYYDLTWQEEAEGVSFDMFYERFKDQFLDITIRKQDVRCLDNFTQKRLPDTFAYKDYVKFCWENPEEIASFTGFSNTIYFLGRDRTQETLYYYPFQDIIIEQVKRIKRLKNDFDMD